MNNPKLIPWLDAGIRRFASMGLEGLNINEISAELKIAKTSFYHFFGSKQDYINELFDYWLHAGTIDLVKEVYLNDNVEDIIEALFRKIIFDNYLNEKFFSQLITSQTNIPAAKKFLNETKQFRQATLDGLYARIGLSKEEARKRGKNLQMHHMGLTQYHFYKEPSNAEKEDIYNNVIELFWPEILGKIN